MIPSKKSFSIGLALVFALTNAPELFATNFSAINGNTPVNSMAKGENFKLFAELSEAEKFFYYADLEPNIQSSKRMTWEGILDNDPPERVACKKSCLSNYGINGRSKDGVSCDDKGWNRCLAYMNRSCFLPPEKDGCREDLKNQCINCWEKHTQSCYDEAFAACINKC